MPGHSQLFSAEWEIFHKKLSRRYGGTAEWDNHLIVDSSDCNLLFEFIVDSSSKFEKIILIYIISIF